MDANFSSLLGRSVLCLGFSLLSLTLAQPGCSSSEAEECDRQGDCHTGERCVRSECRPECTAAADCDDDEVCTVWRFGDQSEAAICSKLEGRFTDCSEDAECDNAAGFSCVEESCRLPCRSHDGCSSVGHCAPIAGGLYCVPGAPTQKGRHGRTCPSGPSDCDTEAGFICVGAGPGDLNSYCTADCAEDDDCPTGFRCGTRRTAPCEDACDLQGAPDRVDCAPLAEIGEGLRYQCGALAVVRRVCERRSFCNTCERDEDCLGTPGQVCARDESGARICTVPCDPTADSCPWGNAAKCGSFDAERGILTCSHRFGSCSGEGKGCEPCTEDADCGTGICSVFGFTGERFCIDLTARCDCGSDADASGVCLGHGCPLTPGGLEMMCLQSRAAGDPLGERCLGASSTGGSALGGSRQAGCWPP